MSFRAKDIVTVRPTVTIRELEDYGIRNYYYQNGMKTPLPIEVYQNIYFIITRPNGYNDDCFCIPLYAPHYDFNFNHPVEGYWFHKKWLMKVPDITQNDIACVNYNGYVELRKTYTDGSATLKNANIQIFNGIPQTDSNHLIVFDDGTFLGEIYDDDYNFTDTINNGDQITKTELYFFSDHYSLNTTIQFLRHATDKIQINYPRLATLGP